MAAHFGARGSMEDARPRRSGVASASGEDSSSAACRWRAGVEPSATRALALGPAVVAPRPAWARAAALLTAW
eukprot:13626743-Heterocapsa_arctica.AAC.1